MLYTSPNSVMSHLVNTEQSQEFLCRALAVLLVSIQNSSWNDEFMFICLLKKGKISIGELWLSIYLCKCFTYSILPIQVLLQPCEVGWAFSPNCSWEHKAGQRSQGWTLPAVEMWNPDPVSLWRIVLPSPPWQVALPPSSAARPLGFNSDSCHLLNLLIYLISLCLSFLICKMGGLSVVFVNQFGMSSTSCAFDFYYDFIIIATLSLIL